MYKMIFLAYMAYLTAYTSTL